MRFKSVAAGLLSAVMWSGAAEAAASITNRDDKVHKLTIIEDGRTAERVLKPQEVLQGICAKGCLIRLGDVPGEGYVLERTDVVSIEDNLVYYDEPAVLIESRPTGEPTPQRPGAAPRPRR